MPVTINDIAKAAKVSKAAVSYVINDKPGVGDETRRRILNVIRDLGFRPNMTARGLAGQKTGMLGLVIPDITDMFFANIVKGVENKANEFGYTLNLCTTHAEPAREQKALDMFIGGRADGVILMTFHLDGMHISALRDRAVPFVLMGEPAEDESVHAVYVDNEEAGYLAARHLLALGHRRIVFLKGSLGSGDSGYRFRGYCRALREYGIDPDPELVGTGEFNKELGYHAALELLGVEPKPTAIFAANDQMAIGAMEACSELGLGVPADISVIGVDNIEAGSMVRPALTTINQPTLEMGALAAEILLNMIRDGHLPAKKFSLKTSLVERNSCARIN